jgi:glycosyltransferase involved in cell wall biosynthesis
MKIAVDSGPLESGHNVRGVGAYARELIHALEQLGKKDEDLEIEAFDFSTENRKLATENFEIAHYTYFHPYFLTLPSRKVGKTVVTIHDLIQLIYPKQYQPGIRGRIKFILQKRRIKHADAIIVPTETTKKDVVRFLNIPAHKIHVVYEAPRDIFKKMEVRSKRIDTVRKKYDLPSRFALYVGDINFNKNIPGLISACLTAKVDLVIAGKQAKGLESQSEDIQAISGPKDWIRYLIGKPHPELAHYKMLVREFKDNPSIHRLGFVPERDLVAIYNLATVYIQPSYYEGFGLPVLEAMACGTPVIVSKTNALVEVAGSAGVVVDHNDKKQFAETIVKVFNDASLRAKMIREGLKRAAEFSWKKAAKETVEVYERVVSGK